MIEISKQDLKKEIEEEIIKNLAISKAKSVYWQEALKFPEEKLFDKNLDLINFIKT